MCDVCVMESVGRQMFSRRDLFRAAGAGAAMVAAASLPATALAAGAKKAADLTHELHEGFPTFGGGQQFFRKQLYNYAEHKFNMFELTVNEHTGTHLDAPLHFSENGQSVAQIPAQNLIAPLCIVDARAAAADNADYQLSPDDIKRWTQKYGDIPNNACVAMNSGWDKYVDGKKFRNVGDDEKMHFPGFHAETAAMLLESNVVGIAVDTLSLDFGPSADFATHYKWLPQNRWGIECIANLDSLPPTGATLIVGAPKHKGGSGGPSRIFALA